MLDLDTILTLTTLAPRHLRASVPDGWQQGRGAFGGLVVAYLIRAAEQVLADPSRPLRSLSAEICAPTQPGPADIHVETLRAGSGLTTLDLRMSQDGLLTAHALAIFARARDPLLTWTEPTPPTPPPFHQLASFLPPDPPTFTGHLDLRPVRAPIFTAHSDSHTEGWLRFHRPPAIRDNAFLALLCDAWWPAAFARLSAPHPALTIAFTLQPLADLSLLAPDAPVFHRAHTPAARSGYSVEFRELWSPTGHLLALNQQTFAVIR